MKLFSPAKVNLFLAITGKRKDGFHELNTVMEALTFGDDLYITVTDNRKIEISCSNDYVPLNEANICWKAIESYFQKSGVENPGIVLDIDKRIPVGSGLGGGSSNAVTLLKGLNEKFAYLEKADLQKIASELGSDTVFFLENKPSLYSGRGEQKVRDFSWPGKHYLLFLPKFSCSTPKVYREFKFGLTKTKAEFSLLAEEFAKANAVEMEKLIRNDLSDPAFTCYPDLKIIRNRIETLSDRKVFLSGSGSTLYSVYDTETQAIDSKKNLTKELAGSVHLVYARSLVKENN